MQIETLAIDRLIPYARNSRTHSDAQVAQIAASIKEFGFTNPVLIDADGNGFDHPPFTRSRSRGYTPPKPQAPGLPWTPDEQRRRWGAAFDAH